MDLLEDLDLNFLQVGNQEKSPAPGQSVSDLGVGQPVDVLAGVIGGAKGGKGGPYELNLDDLPFETSFEDEEAPGRGRSDSVGSNNSAADARRLLGSGGTPPSPSMLGRTPPDPFHSSFEEKSMWGIEGRGSFGGRSGSIAIPGASGLKIRSSRNIPDLIEPGLDGPSRMGDKAVAVQQSMSASSSVGVGGAAEAAAGAGAGGGAAAAGDTNKAGYIGAYSPDARKKRIQRFLEKRKKRVWTKKVKYDVRKNFADSRMRVKGRFVKKEDEELLRELMSIT